MQVDPIGYEDQINLYAYVGNDPLNLTDPTGMEILNPKKEKIDEDTYKKLGELDKKTKGVDYRVTSGQRTKEHNKKIGGSSTSQHVKENGGTAVDVNPIITEGAPEGTNTESLAEDAAEAGFTGIITYTKEDGTSNASKDDGGRLHLDRRKGKFHARAKKNSKGKKYYEKTDFSN